MKTTRFLWCGVYFILMIAVWGCSESNKTESEQPVDLSAKGKEIFVAKNCGQCHSQDVSEESTPAPDLSRAILAKDSSFIQTHLKFVEASKMPSVDFTDAEIRALSHYIARIHAQKFQTIPMAEADVFCPVCSAPLSIMEAEGERLMYSYLNEIKYFDCRDCMETFKQAPGAYVVQK